MSLEPRTAPEPAAATARAEAAGPVDAARPVDGRRVVVALCPGGPEASGGIGRMIAYLQASLARRPGAPRLVIVDTRGPHHIALAPFYFARALGQIALLAARGRIGLVHVNLASNGSTVRKAIVIALLKALRQPYLLHLHGADFMGFFRRVPAPARAVIRAMFRGARASVVLGDVWRAFALGEVRADPARVHVIYNGAPRPARGAEPAAEPVPLILFLGRIDASKGMPELIEALADPALATRPWRLVCAGVGDIRSYRARAEALGVAERVTFTGWVGRLEVEDLLRRARFLVLPSRVEGLPVAVIEALAHGVPAIATPVGATAEIVVDGETGLLVRPGDPKGLAAAMARLLDDDALRRRLSVGGRALFDAKLDAEAIAGRFDALYRAVGRWT